jgi:chromate transporter
MSNDAEPRVSFGEALKVWAKIGVLSFGGPAGQIALMHKELVERRRWIDEGRFLHALNYCMLLPGPEAQQLATYIGWLLHRTAGGLAAGLLFVLPGFLGILVLSMLYASFHELPAIDALFFGLKAAALAVVVEAIFRIGKRALGGRLMVGVAVLAFIGIFLFQISFPLLILAAGLLGWFGHRVWPEAFTAPKLATTTDEEQTVIARMAAAGELGHTEPTSGRAIRVFVIGVLLWVTPIALLAVTLGVDSVFVTEGVFFSKAALVTFGGAYAVLAYIAQQVVENFGWMQPSEMLDGLGLAETTPGPLILVVQFVAFLGAFRDPGALSPMLAGVLGSLVTVWATFVPCFLWIFLGAPYIEALRNDRTLHAALGTITAAIVGVIFNLSVWFALHVMFRTVHEVEYGPMHLLIPELESVDVAAVLLTSGAMIAMLRFHVGLGWTLGGAALLGMAWKLLLA